MPCCLNCLPADGFRPAAANRGSSAGAIELICAGLFGRLVRLWYNRTKLLAQPAGTFSSRALNAL